MSFFIPRVLPVKACKKTDSLASAPRPAFVRLSFSFFDRFFSFFSKIYLAFKLIQSKSNSITSYPKVNPIPAKSIQDIFQ
jgi:hypothetical protein